MCRTQSGPNLIGLQYKAFCPTESALIVKDSIALTTFDRNGSEGSTFWLRYCDNSIRCFVDLPADNPLFSKYECEYDDSHRFHAARQVLEGFSTIVECCLNTSAYFFHHRYSLNELKKEPVGLSVVVPAYNEV